MTKLQKLAQLELERRAVARELAAEELGDVAGGDLQGMKKAWDQMFGYGIAKNAIRPSGEAYETLKRLHDEASRQVLNEYATDPTVVRMPLSRLAEALGTDRESLSFELESIKTFLR